MTIAAALRGASDALHASSPSPALDARVLLQAVLRVEGAAIVAHAERVLEDAQARAFAELVARRRTGEPVAYLTGEKEFYGLPLLVDRRVLVPRPETELLVTTIIREWLGRSPTILDLGTGSGNIACALALALPGAKVAATDVSDAALDVTRANVARAGVTIDTYCGDLFAPLPPGLRFDAIAANLPYVAMDDPALEASVRAHEPKIALDGGDDGLAVYRRMLDGVGARLADGGAIYMEAGPDNAARLAELAHDALQNASVHVENDLAGLPRLVIART